MSANASTVTVPVWENSQVLETDHRVLYRRAVDRDLVAGGGVEDAGLRMVPDMGKETGDGDGAPGFKSSKDRLHELLEMLKGLVREVDIIDPVDLVVAELDIAAEGGTVEMPAAYRFDDVVGEVGPGGDKHVDVPALYEIRDYPPHPRWHHRACEPEEFRCLRIPQHLLADVCRPVQCTTVIGAGFAHRVHQLVDRHPGPDVDLGDRVVARFCHSDYPHLLRMILVCLDDNCVSGKGFIQIHYRRQPATGERKDVSEAGFPDNPHRVVTSPGNVLPGLNRFLPSPGFWRGSAFPKWFPADENVPTMNMRFPSGKTTIFSRARNKPWYVLTICCLGDRMTPAYVILGILVILLISAGCVSEYQNPAIRISSLDLSDITPVNVGSFDTYTVNFRIENPTNVTFGNVRAQIILIPSMTYCHQQITNLEFPVFYPNEKKNEQISFSEFSDLNCQYTYRYKVTSDNIL